LAEVIGDKFADHYSLFMNGLKEILRMTPSETMAQ
jgi:hypothetical protein